MRKQYDDFTQMKMKDMCKAISDMTYEYINEDTNLPTKVPAKHYETILNQFTEIYMSDITSKKFLSIMYDQLSSLKKEDEKYFNQALICLDLGINPKDMQKNEEIALAHTYNYIEEKKELERKQFHFLGKDILNNFIETRDDLQFQGQVIKNSNRYENMREQSYKNKDDYER